MSKMTAQEQWDLAMLRLKFPKGGNAPLVVPPFLYARVKDDPRFADVCMIENAPIPTT